MRETCPRCERPLAGCICRWIRSADPATELLILQHPREAREPKNSAALLRLSLARCRVLVGEQFDPAGFGPLGGTALLYPADGDAAAPAAAAATPVRRVILLDATWRKSRKLLHLNPWLLALPRLALADAPISSRYGGLRRAHAPRQLSTLEAGVLALQQLEPARAADFAPLLDAFAGFVEQQKADHYNPAPSKNNRMPRV